MSHDTETQPSAEALEAENRRRLRALRNQIDYGQGDFAFVLVEYDLPSTLDWLRQQLDRAVPEGITIRHLEMPSPTISRSNSLETLQQAVGDNVPNAILVTGFERWFPAAIAEEKAPVWSESAGIELARAMQPLNLGRNLLRDSFPCPFLLCLPTAAMAVFLRSARPELLEIRLLRISCRPCRPPCADRARRHAQRGRSR